MVIYAPLPAILPAGAAGLQLETAGGLLDVRTADGTLLLGDCRAAVELSDGTRYATQHAIAGDTPLGTGVLLRTPGDPGRPELRWHIEPDAEGNALRLWLEVENTTGRPLAVERLDVLVAPRGFRQVPAADLALAQTGWQSWSPAHPPLVGVFDRENAPPPVIGPMLLPTEAARRIIPWMTLLGDPAGHCFLVGFISARTQSGMIAIQPAVAGHRCTATTYLEGVELLPGAVLRSETLLLVFAQADAAALEQYARALAATMGARTWPRIPTGWCSWYCFFTGVREQDVLRNLDHLAAARHRIPVEYVQLDDGYQAHIGDWLTLNEKFPQGMRFLTDAIRAQGYTPGVWLAPFLVGANSAVYAAHPDWVLRDVRGWPINAVHNWGTENYALDITHPEAAAWMHQVIETMVGAWGYGYLKIDFLYAGALRGVRHDPTCTSVAAYRRGLEIIRAAAGDRFILGCGAPFVPSVGLVDGMRIGSDVAPFWNDPHDSYGSAPALDNAIRATLTRSWMHGHLWINDPDCLLVRACDSALTLPEVQSWTSIVGMTGGMALLSDDLSRLEPERAALLPLVLPVLGAAAVPSRPGPDGTPARLHLAVERPWESWSLATLFNWTTEPQALTFDPGESGLPPAARYHLFDLWTGEHWGPCSGPLVLPPTPAHGARQLTVHLAADRPQLLSSTLHLLGGAVEVADETWADNTLGLRLACPGTHEGTLVVHVPESYTYRPGAAPNPAITRRGNLLCVALSLVERDEVRLPFDRVAAARV